MSIATGKEKYSRKAGIAKAKYDAAKGSMVEDWRAGLARAGVTPGRISTQAYQSGVAAAEYRAGDPEKWERNYRRGITR